MALDKEGPVMVCYSGTGALLGHGLRDLEGQRKFVQTVEHKSNGWSTMSETEKWLQVVFFLASLGALNPRAFFIIAWAVPATYWLYVTFLGGQRL